MSKSPQPVDASDRGPRLPYLPALDGLRAIALATVLAFHGGIGFVHGGYLPLTSFFVLSGFLITALLLAERARDGRTDLRRFWARRVRRLVPGALLGMALVAVYVAVNGDQVSPTVRGDAFASVAWVTNWRFILTGQTYADAFSDPSPFQHYWSLAVEEQFYLVLPLLFVGLFALGRGRRWVFGGAIAALAVASVAWMAHLFSPGDAPLRVYFGTDTRAAELLVGVLLALAMITRDGRLRQFSGTGRRLVDMAGLLALVASVTLWFVTREYDDRLYEGGLIGIALLAAVVVVAGTQPGTAVSRLLGVETLVWVGRRSYGIYLFHWPIFLWLDAESTGLAPVPLLVIRLALTTTLAHFSLRYIEDPIRTGEIPVRIGAVGWANATVAVATVVVLASGSLAPAVTLTTGAQEGELPPPPPPRVEITATSPPSTSTTSTVSSPTSPPDSTPTPVAPAPSSEPVADAGLSPAVSIPTAGAPRPIPSTTTTTSTVPAGPVRVMVVGDSVARNLATGLRQWQETGADIVTYDASINGCPISRGGARHVQYGEWVVHPACGWWATDELDKRLAEFAPHVVVVHSGINEMYDRSHPSWSGIKLPGDLVFDRFIADEWAAAAGRFASTGAAVLWADLPCVFADGSPGKVTNEEADERVGYFNAAFMPPLAQRTGIDLLDFNRQLCRDGYATTVAGVSDARPDGWHLSDEAALALTQGWLGPRVLSAGRR